MPTYNVEFYNANPLGILGATAGSQFTWTGPAAATGTATIIDNETGIEGQTLDDDSAGSESATASVTVGGNTSAVTTVDAEIVWTVRDTVTGQVFEVAQFDVEVGAASGMYTLSEQPLVTGRVYEVVAIDANPNAAAGDIAFNYTQYAPEPHEIDGNNTAETINAAYAADPHGDRIDAGPTTADKVNAAGGNDTVAAGAGNDTVLGGAGNDSIDGGAGNDLLYGDTGGEAVVTSEHLNWRGVAADEANLAAGFTQNTGEMNVRVSFVDTGNNNATFTVESTDTEYVAPGEPMSTTSAGYLYGNGDAQTARVTLDFTAARGSNHADAVRNVQFRINDIDWGSGNHRDIVTVTAYDANGNPVPVTITVSSNDTLSGNTVTAGNVAEGLGDAGGSALFQIAGPVSRIEISYANGLGGTHGIGITDVHFDTIVPQDGNDNIAGGAGEDTLYGEAGNDTLTGGTGNDLLYGGLGDDEMYLSQGDTAYGGDGDDLFVLTDLGEVLSGNITIVGGEGGETNGDTLDLAGLADRGTLNITTPAGTAGGMSGTVTMYDGSVVTFSNIENIICFTPGALILTATGPRPVEELVAGDLIVTRDNGLQPVRWLGRSTVDGRGKHAPVAINSTVLDGARRPLLVSPQHRILYQGYRAELLFGTNEVLIPARHMLDGSDVRLMPRARVTYLHLMLDRHEVIYAEGAATESFHAAESGMKALDDRAREELFAAFPSLRGDLAQHGPTARRCLRRHEARLLLRLDEQTLARAA